jgi:hypothetical protein
VRDIYFLGRFFTRFQKLRGSVIVKALTSFATSSKSLSPVAKTPALAAYAEARPTDRLHRELELKIGILAGDERSGFSVDEVMLDLASHILNLH